MHSWSHGYFADAGYTFGFYKETMPNWLLWSAAMQGHTMPTHRFRYLDVGCGQGLNLIIAAACHPEAEFVGIDFLPEHIAHAAHLAAKCGLTNVQFIEADFLELSQNPKTLGDFDIAVAHGITTWIAPEIRKSLFSLVASVLKPAGIFYNSYNTLPGWLSVVPFQHLVSLEQKTNTGADALEAAKNLMNEIATAAPLLKTQFPGLIDRLEKMKNQDGAYLVQEYNNKHWNPVFFSEMAEELSLRKFTYLASATLLENGTAYLPSKVRETLKRKYSLEMKEQVLDYLIFKAFRRDIYVKGQLRPWRLNRYEYLKSLKVKINPLITLPAEKDKYPVKIGSLAFPIDGSYLLDVFNNIQSSKGAVASIEDLMAGQDALTCERLIQAISYLLSESHVTLFRDDVRTDEAQRVNNVLATAAQSGAPYSFVIVPRGGTAIANSDIDWILMSYHQRGLPRESWSQEALAQLGKLGRTVLDGGAPVKDSKKATALMETQIEAFLSKRVPFLIAMGALKG